MTYRLLQGDVTEVLKTLDAGSVHVACTSPPYWGLRDYGTGEWEGGDDPECGHKVRENSHVEGSGLEGGKSTTGHQREGFKDTCPRCGARRVDKQLGLEATPTEFVENMVGVFREVWRVLRDDGCLFLNLGASYAGSGAGGGGNRKGNEHGQHDQMASTGRPDTPPGFKPKDLIPIPWMVAMALQADGWYLRSPITWVKESCMPESVTDRPTKATEMIFLLTKRPVYYYDADAVREAARYGPTPTPNFGANWGGSHAHGTADTANCNPSAGRNLRDWWLINPEPFGMEMCGVCKHVYTAAAYKRLKKHVEDGKESRVCHCGRWDSWLSHFAVFPSEIPRRAIAAGTSERGCCPECGAGWVRETGRDSDPPKVDPSEIDRFGTGEAGVHRKVGGQYQKWLDANPTKTLGWRPACKCRWFRPKADIPQPALDKVKQLAKLSAWRTSSANNAASALSGRPTGTDESGSAPSPATTGGEPKTG